MISSYHLSKISTKLHQTSSLSRILILFTVYTCLIDSLNLRLSNVQREDEIQPILAPPSPWLECNCDGTAASNSVEMSSPTQPKMPCAMDLPSFLEDNRHCGTIISTPPPPLTNDIGEHHKCDKKEADGFSAAAALVGSAPRQVVNESNCCNWITSRRHELMREPKSSNPHNCLFDRLSNERRQRRRYWSLPMIQLASAIRLVRLDVPQSVQAGQTVRLRCIYDAKNDKLQSLSWYKNGREFFRYQPSERRQPVLVFNATGVQLDISRSRNNTITLVNTTSETSGRYKCEATGTSFQEAKLETYMDVIPANSSGVHAIETNLALLIYATILIVCYLQFTFK